MAKKLSLLMAAVAIVAFAIPASASAVVGLTEPANVRIPIGSRVEFTSINTTISTSVGIITCGSVTTTGTVTTNTTTTVDVSDSGLALVLTCFLGGTKAIQATNVTLTTFHATTTGSGTFTTHVTYDLPNGVSCNFTGSNLPFTYTSGSDSLKINKADLVGTPAACEPGLLSADLTAETENGTPVIID